MLRGGDDRTGRPVGRAGGRSRATDTGTPRLPLRGRVASGGRAYPLSLSLPLSQPEHPHAPIDAFLRGLLPDNDIVLQRWAHRFGVSPRNAFALIREVGVDCAGAVQFVPEERLQGGRSDSIAWLTDDDVATRLRLLREDVSAGRLAGDAGQLSLAGAQPKTALLFDGQRWGVPSGRTATSHILKPALPNLEGHVENEHVCLNLARAFGMPAARSEARMFGDQQAIVVERYDRVDIRTMADAQMFTSFAETVPVYRVHQEDLCQALSLHPSRKYQSDGGPGPAEVVGLLRSVVSAGQPRSKEAAASRAVSAIVEDVTTFRDALIFNWLIGGTDAHAKNYSLLLGGRGLVRLAPLYDIATALVYPHLDPMKARMAMRIGGEYRLEHIGRH